MLMRLGRLIRMMMSQAVTETLRPRPTVGWVALSLLHALAVMPGCKSADYPNPSFPLSVREAKHELAQMADEPVVLDRPVVVLGGWGDLLGLPPAHLARLLRQATGDDRIIAIGYGGCLNFDACRSRTIKHIEKAFPSGDPDLTTEVDVIGFSMGGIVARYTAIPQSSEDLAQPAADDVGHPGKRLNIARLYTISTPHRGAFIASKIAPGKLARDMKPDAPFMQSLDRHLAEADYPVIAYVRLKDLIVGEFNAAPHDQHPYWLPSLPFAASHRDAYKDPRIVADLAKHLRGEAPYTTTPPTPLPE